MLDTKNSPCGIVVFFSTSSDINDPSRLEVLQELFDVVFTNLDREEFKKIYQFDNDRGVLTVTWKADHLTLSEKNIAACWQHVSGEIDNVKNDFFNTNFNL